MENSIFEQGSIRKAYFTLSMPLVFSLIVTMVYNMADTFFISQTQNTFLVAAVSLCAPVFTALMAIGNIFGQGGSSLISRLLGENKNDDIHRVSSFCFYAAIITGAIIGVLLLIFKAPIISILGANQDTFAFAEDYYVVLALGAPASVLTYIHSNLLRAEGMSRESMIGSVGGAVLNIILDPIFISGLKMYAAGAAIATVIGYIFSDLFYLMVILKKSRILSVDLKKMRISANYIGQIFAIGIAAALANLLSSVCVVMTNQFLLPYGNDKIAAMGIVQKVSLIVLLALTGFSFGGSPLIGYYYGAGDRERLKKLLKFCFTFLASLAAVLEVILIIAAPNAMRLFLHDVGIVSEGTKMLRLQLISMVCVAIVLLISIVFQATGKAKESLLLSISRQGIVFVVVLLFANYVAGYDGILVSQAISDVISAGLAIGLYRRSYS